MRVKANTSFTYFYDMVPYQAKAGEEFDGLAARHLVATNADVTSLDEEPAAESGQSVAPVDELDITAKISDVLAWVGDDQTRALEAHAAEENKDKPRPRLLSQLEAIAAGTPSDVDDDADAEDADAVGSDDEAEAENTED